jgi:3-(3-hydroxy-phenyl)propionate hydroxylase
VTRPAAQPRSLYFEYPHFDFVRPPELDGQGVRHAVAVVGAGPVGLTTALELARHGVRVVVLDDKASVNDGSRAICIARHSLEGLQQLEVAERFMQEGLPWTHGTSYFRGQPVYRLEMPHDDDQRFPPMLNLQQQYIEQFLVERATREPLIELRWQSRVQGVTSGADEVTLHVATPDGDYRLVADYVVAADGARSAVRQALGLKLKGAAHEGRYVIVDVKMAMDHPTERRAFFDCAGNPGATVLVHRQPRDIWRIDYQLDETDDEASALAEPAIRAKVAAIVAMLDESAPWQLEWWSIYKAYTLCLDDYRHGRVMFCGDAAHLVPIFGVRGLNSGFADALNVGWKLAAVVRGQASEALLDSYTPERRGATLDIFAQATKSTRFMSPPTRGYRLLRDAALALALDHDFARRLLDPRQSQPYSYADSALSMPDGEGFSGGPPVGAPLPERRCGEQGYLLSHLGRGFTLIYFSDDGSAPAELRAACATLHVGDAPARVLVISKSADAATQSLLDADGRLFAAHDAIAGSCYLVRPDRHVCGRWRQWQPEALNAACARAMARPRHV